MALAKYRAVDLFILTLIMCVLDGIILWAFATLDTPFFVSINIIVILLAVFRWNAWGLIVACIGGVFTAVFANFINESESSYVSAVVIYGIGNIFVALELLMFKFVGKNRINKGGWWLIAYVVIGFLSIIFGRTLVAICFREQFFGYLKQQFIAEALNFVFAVLILFIANKQDSILKDQKEYFLEVRGRR